MVIYRWTLYSLSIGFELDVHISTWYQSPKDVQMGPSPHTSTHVQKRYLLDLKEVTSEGECWNSPTLEKVRTGLVFIHRWTSPLITN